MSIFDRKNQVIFRPSTGEYYTGKDNPVTPQWSKIRRNAMKFTYTDALSVLERAQRCTDSSDM